MSLKTLQKEVRAYYRNHGRRTLPWRKTQNPYRILVSEIMLQQTQVSRVIPKYHSFLKKFPTVNVLALANLGEVLREWQGLGYNRRAKYLHLCAREVVGTLGGTFPKSHSALVALPGIGSYTAGAILAFAYDIKQPIIETNIRSVFLHFCFKKRELVDDKEILPYIEKSLKASKSAREWYQALMDYGAYLKSSIKNPSRKSAHHIVQKKFKGSDREIRGAILRALIENPVSKSKLVKSLSFDESRVSAQLKKLLSEDLVVRKGILFTLP